MLLTSSVPAYLKEEFGCLVEELNCNVHYTPLCLQGPLSGRRSCHIPLFTAFPTSSTAPAWCDPFHLPEGLRGGSCNFLSCCAPSASPSIHQAGAKASDFLGSSTWQLPALAGLLWGNVSSLVSCQVVFCSVTGLGNTTSALGNGQVVEGYSGAGQPR